MAISEARFKWSDDKLINLIKCLLEFKSSTEFRNCDSNVDEVKSYESVRKNLQEIYEDEPEALELLLRTCFFFSKIHIGSKTF